MQRNLAAVALLLFLSLNADAKPGATAVPQDSPLCGVCLELDNETLPDKHYFPSREEIMANGGVPLAGITSSDASSISSLVWTTQSSHAVQDESGEVNVGRGTTFARTDRKHGEPSMEPGDVKFSEWAWGGMKECGRGPEGKITAGCHTAHYDNLLCSSHYDDCDDELFTLAVNAVHRSDAAALRDLIEYPGRSTVVLNRGRSAIQLVGCTGEIVGHLPVDPALLRALR